MTPSTQKNVPAFPFFFLCCFFLLTESLFSATITYQEDSTTNFENPERGYRNGKQDRIAVSSIDRVYFEIGQYRSTDVLPQSVFDNYSKTCALYRSQGRKLLTRFCYSMESGADAPLDRILKHIEQLGPVLRENADVVSHFQAGFIGAWGEWHHSGGADPNKLDNPEAHKAVLFKLLDVLPKDRMVVLRYNRHKREIFGDLPLEPDSAFSGSHRARVGFINDCFTYNESDRGTYNTKIPAEIEAQKLYLSQENRYVPQEGESCGSSSYSACENAIKDLKRMHFDGLNCRFLHAGWAKSGCLNTICMLFGYRIVLKNAQFSDVVRPGYHFYGSINLQNVGWGKIYNPRGCELVFRNVNDKNKKVIVKLGNDPRRWCMTDSVVNVPVSATIPENMPPGTYQVYLNLPDPYPSLHDRKEYSIRLANKNIWEDSTGYNSLEHKVEVSMHAPVGIVTGDATVAGGIESVRVKMRRGSIEFALPRPATTPVTFEIFTLSGAKVWRRTVMPGDGSACTVKWTGGSSSVYLWKVSQKQKESSITTTGSIRSLIVH